MGLDLINSVTNESIYMSYSSFFTMRKAILEVMAPEFVKEWENLPYTQRISEEFVTKMMGLGIVDLILHSDCDGKLGRRQIKKLYTVLSSVEGIEYRHYIEFKKLLKHTLDKGGIIEFC